MWIDRALRGVIFWPSLLASGLAIALAVRNFHRNFWFHGLLKIGVVCISIPIIDLLRGITSVRSEWHSWLYAFGITLITVSLAGIGIEERDPPVRAKG